MKNKICTVDKIISTLTLKEKVGQFFMAPAFINDSDEEINKLENLIVNHNIGGLCFFHSRESAAANFEKNRQSKSIEKNTNNDSLNTLKLLIERYQSAAKYPLLISIDAEWGLAMRVENTPQYPYALTLGATQKKLEFAYQVGKQIAKDCKAVGVNWNLSPVIDINTNPRNPVIGYRSFGDDQHDVYTLAHEFIKGAHSEGVLTSIKHFPGHGDTEIDSHLGLPIINKSKKELLENELYPFQKLIDEGVDSIMAGHLSIPSLSKDKTLPSSINKDIIKGLLRNEMGYQGVVVSDALNMQAVSKYFDTPGQLEWKAFDAGNDILCFAEHVDAGIQAILKNANEDQINTSLKRIWQLKQRAFINLKPRFLQPENTLSNPSDLNKRIAEDAITLLYGDTSVIADFSKTDYCTISLNRKPGLSESEILCLINNIKQEILNKENILLNLSPPQMKPKQNFGFLKEEIDFINELITTKETVLYLFGNPYILNYFDINNTKATVIAYQDFEEFHEVARLHFLGQLKANGKLPVELTK